LLLYGKGMVLLLLYGKWKGVVLLLLHGKGMVLLLLYGKGRERPLLRILQPVLARPGHALLRPLHQMELIGVPRVST
jgi:hypothetical protein